MQMFSFFFLGNSTKEFRAAVRVNSVTGFHSVPVYFLDNLFNMNSDVRYLELFLGGMFVDAVVKVNLFLVMN